MIGIKTTTAPVSLPLVCDPTMRAANPVAADGTDPLELFNETGSATELVIPAEASIAVLRPLTRILLDEAQEAARPPKKADMALFNRLVADIRARVEASKCEPGLNEQQARDAAARAVDDASSDEDQAAIRRVNAYGLRLAIEQVRRALVSLSDVPDIKRSAAGFPVEELLTDLNGETVVRELARRVGQVSTLGKPGPQSSASGSGVTTPGRASSAAAMTQGATDCLGPTSTSTVG